MDYTNTVPFKGSTEKAIDLAAIALTALGFRITARDSSSLDTTGPGMTSTRQSALRLFPYLPSARRTPQQHGKYSKQYLTCHGSPKLKHALSGIWEEP